MIFLSAYKCVIFIIFVSCQTHSTLTSGIRPSITEIPNHLLHKLDTLCLQITGLTPPEIEHGQFIRYESRQAHLNGRKKYKKYLVAEYKCNAGFKFKKLHSGLLFCSKGSWIGKRPICIKELRSKIDNVQKDEPTVSIHKFVLDSEKCSAEYTSQCDHGCKVVNGQSTCICLPGFARKENSCEDINECAYDNGGCQHTCRNTLGSYHCKCPKGFRLNINGKTCEDVNECLLRNGHGPCQDICENTDGSYRCSCSTLKGTRLAADNHTCADVNECTEGISGCSHTCINTHGRVYCTCPGGMELGQDWKTCQDINECEDPLVKAACKFGCKNLIGSYYCVIPDDEMQSDQPISNNETTEDEEDYEEGDYEDDYESEDDYNEEENYVDKEESEVRDSVPNKYNGNFPENKEMDREDLANNLKEENMNYKKEQFIENNTKEIPLKAEEGLATVEHGNSIIANSGNKEDVISQQISTPKNEKINEYDDDYEEEYYEEYEDNTNEKVLGGTNDIINTESNDIDKIGTSSRENENDAYDNTVTNASNESKKAVIDSKDNAEESMNKTSFTLGHSTSEDILKRDEAHTKKNTEDPRNEVQDIITTTPKQFRINRTNQIPAPEEGNREREHNFTVTNDDTDNYEENYNESEYDEDNEVTTQEENVEAVHPTTENTIYSHVMSTEIDIVHDKIDKTNMSSMGMNSKGDNDKEHDVAMETKMASDNEEYDSDYDEDDNVEDYESKEIEVKTNYNKIENHVLPLNITDSSTIIDQRKTNIRNSSTNESEEYNGIDKVLPKDKANNVNVNITTNIKEDHTGYDKDGYQSVEKEVETEKKHTKVEEHISSLNIMNSTTIISNNQSKTNMENGHITNETYENDRNDKGLPEDKANNIYINVTTNIKEDYDEDVDNEHNDTDVDKEKSMIVKDQLLKPIKIEEIEKNSNVTILEEKLSNITPGSDVLSVNKEDAVTENNEENYEDYDSEYEEYDEQGTEQAIGYLPTSTVKHTELSNTAKIPDPHLEEKDNETISNQNNVESEFEEYDDELEEDNPEENIASTTILSVQSTITTDSNKDDFQCDNENCKVVTKSESNEKEFQTGRKTFTPVTHEFDKVDCSVGYRLEVNGTCADIDECELESHQCSDTCENTIGSYKCACTSGFHVTAQDPYTCQDINECLQNPCSHICINEEGSYICKCPPDFVLEGTNCVNMSCSHDQTRINNIVQCTCPVGYLLGEDRRTCEDIDECMLQNDCSQTCENLIGSYKCACEAGFILQEDKKTCVDVDECKANHGCPQLCENLLGSFKCTCEEGYHYNATGNICNDINECAQNELNNCVHLCINYDGGYECTCKKGFKLLDDGASCEDIDECQEDNGNCSQICSNTVGSYGCNCNIGYNLDVDNQTCSNKNLCFINNGGCSHECIDVKGMASCKCPEGYILEEKTTCVQINPCAVNNGGCSHFCEFTSNHINCLCPNSHILQNNTHCVEKNLCEQSNGGCSHFCKFENHSVICSCPENHELGNRTHCFIKNPCLNNNGGCSHECVYLNEEVICNCPKNYFLEGKTCFKTDPCLINNGGCSHKCYSDEDGTVECSCPKNYKLKEKSCIPEDGCLMNNGNCSHICISSLDQPICSCPEGLKLKNLTHCEIHNPCLDENGGCSDICENTNGKAECSCPEKYILLADMKNCVLQDPCQHNNGGCSHSCIGINGNVHCSCPDNYRLLDDMKNCILEDPCLLSNGGCSHICQKISNDVQCSCPDHHNLVNETTCVPVNPCFINNGGCSHECITKNYTVFCLCPEGYKSEGKKCIHVNPCATKNGGCSHQCNSIDGHVICKCPPGYELINKTCFKINPCLLNNGGCSHSCTNVRGQVKCSCPPGYKLFGKVCLDEDPCLKNNGGCSHFCQNKEGKRECSCPLGYMLRPNKRVCKEINECRVNRGGCSHGCRNLPGSFECFCPKGQELDYTNKTCIDINECVTSNGGCEGYCKNFRGGFRCECPPGQILNKDQRTCRTVHVNQCRIPKVPINGLLNCSDVHMTPGSVVAIGASCNILCNDGYSLIGHSYRICNSSGLWSGQEPDCIATTCPKIGPIKNGWFLPAVCNSGKSYPGESCHVFCRKGYKSRAGFDIYHCGDNLQWTPTVLVENLQDACIKDVPEIPFQVYINCPNRGQLSFTLPPGQRHMHVKIPRPESNVDWSYITSNPSWGKVLEATLPAGRTELIFSAYAPADNNSRISCHLTINVLDKENPTMAGCPENIERKLYRGETSQLVHWREPQFTDNVGVSTLYKSREPGTQFGVGLHHINYIASDEAGNRAFCHFTVTIRSNRYSDESLMSNEISNDVYDHAARRYRAVLICPSGIRYSSKPSNNYENAITSETGCYWRHIKVTSSPLHPQNYRANRVLTESRLPAYLRSRNNYFKWYR